ncbi:MAG: alpha/beta hydrolase [Cyclobacteriaceae bacterium]|nr:alpha/beta hydrolase [Cyclobacteriaceae bacterium]
MSRKKKDKTPPALRFIRWLFPRLERWARPLANKLFVKIFFTPLNYPYPEKEKKAIRYAKQFTFRAAGKNLQGYKWGDSEKYVLVVHGWAGRATQFRRFIKPLLKEGFSVVGFDGPAHGRSEGKLTNIREFEEALNKLFELQGVPHAIIGHSFGGAAVIFAAQHGLHVKKLVAIATPTVGDWIIDTYLRAINGSEQTKQWFKQYVLRTYGKPFDAFTASHAIQHLRYPMDLLLVYDKDDQEVAPAHAHRLKELYPPAKLLITSGLGHTRILKDSRVIAWVTDYIAGNL